MPDNNIRMEVHTKEVIENIREAIKLTVRDVVVDIAHDYIKNSPAVTGHNRRGIAYKVEGMRTGEHLQSPEAGEIFEAESQVEAEAGELEFNEGAVYPTSGYGGYLETGTVKMAAQPALKPAMDRNFTEEKTGKLLKEHLGE
jgi:hypothetical protein